MVFLDFVRQKLFEVWHFPSDPNLMDFVLHNLRHIFPIRKANKLTTIVQNEKVLKGSASPIEVKIHGSTQSIGSVLSEILRLLNINLLEEGHFHKNLRQYYPILGNLDLLFDLLRMVDHIAVAASVVVPAHLEQCEEGNLAIIISPVIVVQCHMRNTLVRIDAEHSEVVCDLLQQCNISLSHFSPHLIL